MTAENDSGLAAPRPGAAGPSARGLGRSRRQFELYTQLSVDLLVVMLALVLVVDIWTGRDTWGVGDGVLTVCVVALTALTVVMVHRLPYGRPPRRPWLAALAVLTALLMGGMILGYSPEDLGRSGAGVYFPPLAALVIAFAGASLFVPWRRLLPAAGIATVASTTVFAVIGIPAAGLLVLGLYAAFAALLGIATGAMTFWMLDVIRQLDEARSTAARLAVAEERLRFSRDLHDVYGRTLSAIALKSELAGEFATRGDDRAVTEMRAVRALAQESLAEVRGIVAGYREISLETEISGAIAMLRSAGARFEVRGLDDARTHLGAPEQAILAWAVRESVTNVIRHGRASTVTLSAETAPGFVTVTIRNDGVDHPGDDEDPTSAAAAPDPRGSGLVGLRERAASVGGTVRASRSGATFSLVVTLPVTNSGAGEPAGMAAHEKGTT